MELPQPSEPTPGNNEEERCWLCGALVVEEHCKLICRRCGFTRDCSDP